MEYIEIRIKGRTHKFPYVKIGERKFMASSKWLKVAVSVDEELIEGEVVGDPPTFINKLKLSGLEADLLTFPQRICEPNPKYSFHFEWDNVAAISTQNYAAWWESLPQETRKNVRRSVKKGVTVHVVRFDDEFVKMIKEIYDESPIRQGMRFWHFGKDLGTVKMENATYLERSEFIGAYCGPELIGFMKFVYTDNVARIMQILAKSAHHDKRPMNALIAKAVEVCEKRGISFLVYSRLKFGNKKNSQLAEFKTRNGFKEMLFPRYYVPLTIRGKIALAFRLHRGPLGILPSWLINLLLWSRSSFLNHTQKMLARTVKNRHIERTETVP